MARFILLVLLYLLDEELNEPVIEKKYVGQEIHSMK